jgi:hypothetical protein
MKYGIVIIPLILQFSLLSQDYQTVRPEYTAFYNQMNTIRIDSITQSGDTTFLHNFRMIRGDNDYGCYNLYGDSWTGKPIIILPSGLNLFVNKESDTISIDTQANLGDERLLYTYPDGRFIVSTVSEHDTIGFFGLTDSVKTITLQVKDSNGNSIDDPMNERFLKLGKNYGFINILDFYDFPYENYNINDLYYFNPDSYLIGTAGLGYQNFGAEEIFDFDINDELHIYEYGGDYYPNVVLFDKHIILKVIEKVSTENTVTYQYARCYRYDYTDFDNPDNSYQSVIQDTLQDVYDFSEFDMTKLGNISYEPYDLLDGYTWTFLRGKSVCNEWFGGEDLTCLSMPIGEDPVCNSYLKGLGGPYYDGCGSESPPCGRHLVYYKKGTMQWGTHYNCNELSNENTIPQDLDVKLYPNPANDFIFVELSGIHPRNVNVLIQTLEGKQLLSLQYLSESQKIDISG